MKYVERIKKKLQKNFSPRELEVIDESDQHAGHSGAQPGGETHFRVRMTSDKFIGKSRVENQRQGHRVLEAELQERIHALSLELSTPEKKH